MDDLHVQFLLAHVGAGLAFVNDHRLKAVASGYGLKPDLVGHEGRLAIRR